MIKKYIINNKTELKQCIEDLKHKDTFYKQIPNLLTFIRLIGGIPAGILYYLGLPYLSIALIAFLWLTDAIDGHIARKYHLQSKIGADMDAFADKIMFLSSTIPLLVNAPGLIINITLEGVISIINVFGRIKKLDTKTVLSGKFKTVFLAITLLYGYLVKFLNLPISIFNILKITTTAFQFLAIKDYLVESIRMNKELQDKKSNSISIDTDNEKEGKKLIPEFTNNQLDELRNEKDFLLSSKEQDIINKPKTRIRKKNNHN